MEQELQRRPEPEEIAAHLEMGVEQVRRALKISRNHLRTRLAMMTANSVILLKTPYVITHLSATQLLMNEETSKILDTLTERESEVLLTGLVADHL